MASSGIKQTKIKKIVCLVHPFFSAHISAEERRKSPTESFAAGVWGREIKEIAKRKDTILIVFPSSRGRYFKNYAKFMRFIKAEFSLPNARNRVIFLKSGDFRLVHREGHKKREAQLELIAALEARNLVFDPEHSSVVSKGEREGSCVFSFGEAVRKTLGIKKPLRIDLYKSVGYRASGTLLAKAKLFRRERKKKAAQRSRQMTEKALRRAWPRAR